ncbi:MAG: NADH-ubiquinone oxidoreductase-F iron-sulfur binding region domain-containing protein [Fusobacteriaceae bacterium]
MSRLSIGIFSEAQLTNLIDDILKGSATLSTLNLIKKTAETIYYTSDCAIGYEVAIKLIKMLQQLGNLLLLSEVC